MALLLWAVRLIRTGIERAFLPQLRRILRRLSGDPLGAAAGGAGAAMLLQSATAVALMAAGFAASGLLAVPAALALLLGAELGSALMTQVLVLPVQDVAPFALLAGVLLFFRGGPRRWKQVGRILIGFALVLLALGMIHEVTEPIGSSRLFGLLAGYLADDPFTAYAIGAALAWAMHSSLAAVLTMAAFAAGGLLAAPAAAAMVVGANLGGAMIPLVLLGSAPRPARIVVAANALARCAVTLACLGLLAAGSLDLGLLGAAPGQQVISLHIALNAALLVLALPLRGWLCRLAGLLVPPAPEPDDTISALDPDALGNPKLALACAQREILRMGETVQAMLGAVIGLLRTWDDETAQMIARREDALDRMHYETKLYLSRLQESEMTAAEARRAVQLVAMANNLEEAGDRISSGIVALARKLKDQGLAFSDEGMAELAQFHDQVATNARLALSVLTTQDPDAARQLLEEKDRLRREEQRLQQEHLQRLRNGETATIETTNIHQEVLRQLKQINAALSYAAYPIAEETGALLDSRLARPARGEAR